MTFTQFRDGILPILLGYTMLAGFLYYEYQRDPFPLTKTSVVSQTMLP